VRGGFKHSGASHGTPPAAVRLNKANVYQMKVSFPSGDVTFDCVTLKSRGK